ncbi:restriction endonuclease subunit S [Aliivibrio fischeri]|uniref:restriction endonuclease subunit S n=1 Tax=Aliivibrio fischeri TaxID=668 RepID=UPI0012DA7936|nr:restriction endonuclease subunit S [Aliivibrio fischeri]MUJ27465.1 restriction endonuclease subunit S [Aliivibrio fischeri]
MSWPKVKLRNLIVANYGKALKKEDRDENGHCSVFGSAGSVGFHAESLIDIQTIVVGRKGSVGKIIWAPNGGWIIDTAYYLTLIGDVSLDWRYLYYALQVANLGQKTITTSIPGLNRDDFYETEIPLPPLEEQKHIAAILDKADAIRQKRKQAIELADEFLRSVFLDMFGDPVSNPKGWEVKSLAELCDGKLQNGAYFPKDAYSEEGVEMVHMGDAFYDYIPRGKMKRVLASSKDIEKYAVTGDDILISRRSLNYEGAAKPSLIMSSDEPLLFESSLIRFRPVSFILNKSYMFGYLSNETVKEQKIRKYVTGATIKGISQKNLEKVEVLVPPIAFQNRYELVVNNIGKLKKKLCSEGEFDLMFNALSQKAFSGQL